MGSLDIAKRAKFYDRGAEIVFEGYGAQVKIDGLHGYFLNHRVPENMIGILRGHQVVVNPEGVQVVEIRFDAEMLYHHLGSERLRL